MFPVLYESTEKDFKTRGLGTLTKASYCYVTEKRNGEYELEMSYPCDYDLSLKLAVDNVIVASHSCVSTDLQPFRIYKVAKNLDGSVTVNARHVSYQLSEIVTTANTTAFTTASAAMDAIFSGALSDCNFTHETDVMAEGTFTIGAPASIRSLLGSAPHSVLASFGGEFEWDRWNVILHASRGKDRGVALRYGVDITDLTAQNTSEDYKTGVVCYWHGKDSSGSDTYIVGEPSTSSAITGQAFDRFKIYDASKEYSSAPTQDTLTALAATKAAEELSPIMSQSVTVAFTSAWLDSGKQPILLCDTVRVLDARLGVDVTRKVIATKFNVLLDRYEEIELGDPKDTIEGAVASLSSSVSDLQSDVSTAQSDIKDLQNSGSGGASSADIDTYLGINGGYIRINHDANGKPYEILIMDTDSQSTATNVIKLNKDGVLYSSSGYNGTYTQLIKERGGYINASKLTGWINVEGSANTCSGIIMHHNGKDIGRLAPEKFYLRNADYDTSTHAEEVNIQPGFIQVKKATGTPTDAKTLTLSTGGSNIAEYTAYNRNGSLVKAELSNDYFHLWNIPQNIDAPVQFRQYAQFFRVPRVYLKNTKNDADPSAYSDGALTVLGDQPYIITAGTVKMTGDSETIPLSDAFKAYAASNTRYQSVFLFAMNGATVTLTGRTSASITVAGASGTEFFYLVVAKEAMALT